MESLKNYIEKLKELKDAHKVIESLKQSSLDIQQKNLIYLYLFPRPLLDKELPIRIQEARRSSGNNGCGYLEENMYEVSLIIEAYRTEQYKRFIKHLLHTFTVPENIHPVNGFGQCNCAICGKNIYEFGSWTSECSKYKTIRHPEETRKEYLAFGGKGSTVNLCLDCIVQLQEVNKILESIEPGYLKSPWQKRFTISS